MNESDWANCREPQKMLDFVRERGLASDRKFRLFACACVRRICPLLTDERSREAIEVGERHADHLADNDEMRRAALASQAATVDGHGGDAPTAAFFTVAVSIVKPLGGRMRHYDASTAEHAARAATFSAVPSADAFGPEANREWASSRGGERLAQCGLLRCVFGNPFRALPALPPLLLSWHDGLVPSLAQSAYEGRQLPSGHLDPQRLAVLADALEDAGCSGREVLGHLRGPGPHVRGCHVVDLLLGKV
jgi:hypothetical protein